jgi:two-component system CheB/CheR fusion protein
VLDTDRRGAEFRVLLFTPTGRDARITQVVLAGSRIASTICGGVEDLRREAQAGVGSVLMAEEAITTATRDTLADLVAHQPPWSDLPMLILTRPGADSATVAAAVASLGNVTLLERPIRVPALVSAVQVALRARNRQYELRARFEAQSLLAAIVATSDDAIISRDLDGIITSWNAGAERLFGYTAKEAIGRPVTLIYPPDRLHEDGEMLERVRRRESIEHYETVRRRRDGTEIDLSLSISPIVDASGCVVGASKIARDITLAKRADEALRQSEERFRSLVSVITDVPWTMDASGAFIAPQPAWARYTGQPWEEHRGLGWANAVHPDDRAHVLGAWEQARGSRGPYESHGRLWHAATQEYRHFVARATRLLDRDGGVREWVGTCTDVHERKRAEEALRDADRRKDEFLATLAHELRNPLAPIRNSLHILDMAGTPNPAVEYVRDMMERQVNHLVRLVDDLMEVSRITRGRIELRRERVELEAVIRSAVETSQPFIEAGGHQLVLDVPAEPLTLEADPIRLAQVFANLLNNAAKYTEKPSRIWLTAGREGGSAVVSIRDQGIGIPAELLPHVFEMFTQVDTARRGSQSGLGIGLSLARNLVQLHGGTVTATSAGPGEGSEFVVRLPLAGGLRADRTKAPADPASLHPLRVLVVDDNRDAADSLAMMLKFLGAEVRVVYEGPAALREMESFSPNLLLLDLGMPDMDGYEVARRIREHPAFHDVILIALTGWGQEEDRRRSHTSGFDHHLIKPTGIDALRALLASAGSRGEVVAGG